MLTSNRATPRGAHSGLIWIFTVPVLPSSPSTFPISKVTIRPVDAAAEVSSAKAGSLRKMLATPPAKTAFLRLLKTSRRRLKAASSVPDSGWWWAEAMILMACDGWLDGTTKASVPPNKKLSCVALRQTRSSLLIEIIIVIVGILEWTCGRILWCDRRSTCGLWKSLVYGSRGWIERWMLLFENMRWNLETDVEKDDCNLFPSSFANRFKREDTENNGKARKSDHF